MDKRARFAEKRTFVLHWLLEFRFSTRDILCEALGLVRSNQSSFFVSLKKSGLVMGTRHPLVNEELLLLTHSGKQYSANLDPLKADRYYAHPSKILTSTTVHSLCIQRAVIRHASMALPFTFKSERFLGDIEAAKRPDALVDEEGVGVALEVELTQKTASRIYLGYLDHIENMKADNYDRVRYVFPKQSLCETYQARFDKPEWPVFIRDRYGKVKAQMDGDQQVMARADSGNIRGRFLFEWDEGLTV